LNWGTNDEIGALNGITPDIILSSIRLVKKGKVLSLGQTYETNMPAVWFHGPFFYSTYRNAENCLKLFKEFRNELGSTVCRYELSDHTGTHVDPLNHAAKRYTLYNGFDIRKITTDSGTTKLGIDTMPPVFTRGILLDFPSFFGTSILEPSYEITPAAREQNTLRMEFRSRDSECILLSI
jgi:Putative cyclase